MFFFYCITLKRVWCVCLKIFWPRRNESVSKAFCSSYNLRTLHWVFLHCIEYSWITVHLVNGSFQEVPKKMGQFGKKFQLEDLNWLEFSKPFGLFWMYLPVSQKHSLKASERKKIIENRNSILSLPKIRAKPLQQIETIKKPSHSYLILACWTITTFDPVLSIFDLLCFIFNARRY